MSQMNQCAIRSSRNTVRLLSRAFSAGPPSRNNGLTDPRKSGHLCFHRWSRFSAHNSNKQAINHSSGWNSLFWNLFMPAWSQRSWFANRMRYEVTGKVDGSLTFCSFYPI